MTSKMLPVVLGLLSLGAAPGPPPPSPVPTYAMHLTASTSVSGQEFQIKLKRTANAVQLWYGRRDSVLTTRLRKDPDNLTPDSIEALVGHATTDQYRERLSRYGRAIGKYKVFTQDSIRLEARRYPAFVQLLDSVYRADKETLERQEANRDRRPGYVAISLGGTSVSLEIKADRQPVRQFYAHSPRLGSHPLFYRLLHESLQVYRQDHPASFLTPRVTAGY